MKIGFIGCGNMAKSIIKGVLTSKITCPENIYAAALNQEKLAAYASQIGIHHSDNIHIAKECDVIIFAIKPQKFSEVLPPLKPHLNGKLVLSIAAAKTIDTITALIGEQKIIRVMPNLNAAIQQSVSAICANAKCVPEDISLAKTIFECIGSVYEVEETNFSAFSACACCSPAYTFLYIDALAQGAIQCGLDEATAYRCATESVLGSAQMLSQSHEDAPTLVNKVCSPGGTTIEGVHVLQQNGFSRIVEQAIHASYQKDKTL